MHNVCREPSSNCPRVIALLQAQRTMSAVSVAVVQGQPWHFEVIAALIYSFVQIGSDITLYCRNTQTSNLQKVIEPWYSTTFRPYEEFEPVSCNYSLVVFVTFPEGHEDLIEHVASKSCKQQYIAIVHNPDQLKSPAVQALLWKARPAILSLGPHTQVTTANVLKDLGYPSQVHTFVPDFLVENAEGCYANSSCGVGPLNHETSTGFIIQGNLDPGRRHYDQVFQQISDNPALLNEDRFKVTILGRGSLEIPEMLVEKVTVGEGLDFEEYYANIRRGLAVMPAFAGPHYYCCKSSSSVAAALVAGTPLVASQKLLDAYSYLDSTTVFMQYDNETDVQAMERIMLWHADEVSTIRDNLKSLKALVNQQNLQLLRNIIKGSTVL